MLYYFIYKQGHIQGCKPEYKTVYKQEETVIFFP
jgi:hypothetical protein